MPGEARRRLGIVVRIAVVAAAAAFLFVPLPESWSGSWRNALLDFGHVPLFAALVLVGSIPGRSPWRPVLLATFFAGFVEVVQSLIGRSPDWGDFLRGVLGSFAAAFLLLAWRNRRHSIRLLTFTLAVVLTLLWPVFDSGPLLLDAYEGERDFPLLASFRTERELHRWSGRQAELNRIEGEAMVAFLPGPDPYPSVSLEPIRRDFRGYQWICCSLEVFGEPLHMVISIRGGPLEEGHTRHIQFGRRYEPGIHKVRLALKELTNPVNGPPLDLADIRTVQFYVIQPREPRSIQIRRIWLEE